MCRLGLGLDPNLKMSILVIVIRVRSRVVGVVYVWMDYDTGMGPYHLQMMKTSCTPLDQ